MITNMYVTMCEQIIICSLIHSQNDCKKKKNSIFFPLLLIPVLVENSETDIKIVYVLLLIEIIFFFLFCFSREGSFIEIYFIEIGKKNKSADM